MNHRIILYFSLIILYFQERRVSFFHKHETFRFHKRESSYNIILSRTKDFIFTNRMIYYINMDDSFHKRESSYNIILLINNII